MKKLLFLFFIPFILASCSDGTTNNVEIASCPINSSDFTYERVKFNQYQIKLNDESKRGYEKGVIWMINDENNISGTEYYEIEPLLEWKNGSEDKKGFFYYNNVKCGDNISFKPVSTYKLCDDVKVDYLQTAYNGSNNVLFLVKYDTTFDLSLNAALRFDNGFVQNKNAANGTDYHQFSIPYSDIQSMIQVGTNSIYADVIIYYPDNTECVKELKYNILN